eukprot:gb/GECG01013933.1/.p1 GENE.gb/GECG01013933.1/~~gb/GECG01013933.1/.p1  ORF type:complete len:100 (+),score=5.15 gb/GECG01013933.1/:1-300(+)
MASRESFMVFRCPSSACCICLGERAPPRSDFDPQMRSGGAKSENPLSVNKSYIILVTRTEEIANYLSEISLKETAPYSAESLKSAEAPEASTSNIILLA